VAEPVIWIDQGVADFHEESILVIKQSGDVELMERWSRAAFQDFIEVSAQMLADQDRRDQQKTARIGRKR
jgi:hypothetical protein